MLRLLFIVLLLIGLSIYKKNLKRVNKIDLLALVFLGVIGVFINQWSFFMGLQTADSTTSALILATTPILTGFLAAIFSKGKINNSNVSRITASSYWHLLCCRKR